MAELRETEYLQSKVPVVAPAPGATVIFTLRDNLHKEDGTKSNVQPGDILRLPNAYDMLVEAVDPTNKFAHRIQVSPVGENITINIKPEQRLYNESYLKRMENKAHDIVVDETKAEEVELQPIPTPDESEKRGDVNAKEDLVKPEPTVAPDPTSVLGEEKESTQKGKGNAKKKGTNSDKKDEEADNG